MQYIQKLPNPSAGTKYIDDFLRSCWNGAEYLSPTYNALPKTGLRDQLLNEQNHLCCYCMKELSNDYTTTLEHIVPHKADIAEFNKYTVSVITDNVIHKSLFNKDIEIAQPAHYPHDIAYHNLIASCNSNSHCNHRRGDNFINTFFYDDGIENKVDYDFNGNVFSDEYFDDLEAVEISTSAELIIFRKIWNELSKLKEDPDDITDDDILEVVAAMQVKNKFERKLNDFWDSPSKRPDLLKYKWFFHYYKNN